MATPRCVSANLVTEGRNDMLKPSGTAISTVRIHCLNIFDMLVLVITCSSHKLLAEIHPTASASTHSTAARTELILDICLFSGGCNMILHNSVVNIVFWNVLELWSETACLFRRCSAVVR